MLGPALDSTFLAYYNASAISFVLFMTLLGYLLFYKSFYKLSRYALDIISKLKKDRYIIRHN